MAYSEVPAMEEREWLRRGGHVVKLIDFQFERGQAVATWKGKR